MGLQFPQMEQVCSSGSWILGFCLKCRGAAVNRKAFAQIYLSVSIISFPSYSHLGFGYSTRAHCYALWDRSWKLVPEWWYKQIWQWHSIPMLHLCFVSFSDAIQNAGFEGPLCIRHRYLKNHLSHGISSGSHMLRVPFIKYLMYPDSISSLLHFVPSGTVSTWKIECPQFCFK